MIKIPKKAITEKDFEDDVVDKDDYEIVDLDKMGKDDKLQALKNVFNESSKEENANIKMIELYQDILDLLKSSEPKDLIMLGELHSLENLEHYEQLTLLNNLLGIDFIEQYKTFELMKMIPYKNKRGGNFRDTLIKILQSLIKKDKVSEDEGFMQHRLGGFFNRGR